MWRGPEQQLTILTAPLGAGRGTHMRASHFLSLGAVCSLLAAACGVPFITSDTSVGSGGNGGAGGDEMGGGPTTTTSATTGGVGGSYPTKITILKSDKSPDNVCQRHVLVPSGGPKGEYDKGRTTPENQCDPMQVTVGIDSGDRLIVLLIPTTSWLAFDIAGEPMKWQVEAEYSQASKVTSNPMLVAEDDAGTFPNGGLGNQADPAKLDTEGLYHFAPPGDGASTRYRVGFKQP